MTVSLILYDIFTDCLHYIAHLRHKIQQPKHILDKYLSREGIKIERNKKKSLNTNTTNTLLLATDQ